MKKAIVFLAMILMATPVTAEQWIIEGSGDDVQMRPRYDYDYSRRYKGEIEDDGYTRLRNPYTGERLRGYIEDDGYGYLRDSEGIDIKFGLGENSRLSLNTKGYYLGRLILDITYQKILLWQTVPAEDNLVDVVCYMLSAITREP